ncbi:MAG: flagellar protein FliT [Thermoanaerobacterales bacterium]|nr:flagellar protein FliT [Thermoanaerobacterales bacterium]
MPQESVCDLLNEIRAVTKKMVDATEAGDDGLDTLASLLERRQELMNRVDNLHREQLGAPKDDEIQRIRELLREIREMDIVVRQAVAFRRELARKALERARNERKGLAYLKSGMSLGGGLVNDKG